MDLDIDIDIDKIALDNNRCCICNKLCICSDNCCLGGFFSKKTINYVIVRNRGSKAILCECCFNNAESMKDLLR